MPFHLQSAKFIDAKISSGQSAKFTIKYTSPKDCQLDLSYDTTQFGLNPNSFQLAANPSGGSVSLATAITRNDKGTQCDVMFSLHGDDDEDHDSIEVD